MAPVFGYWNIRGLATPIRLLLEYAGADYEEKLYSAGPPPDMDRTEWLNDKTNLGLAFPNLPYYIDGDLKLTQSHSILRYLAKKHGLVGKTDQEQAVVDMVASTVYDYHIDYAKIVYNPAFNDLKAGYAQALPAKLKTLSDFLGQKEYVAGDYVTYADFVLFEYLEGQLYFSNEVLKDFPVLDQFHKRILALKAVDEYFKSPKAIKFPFNGAPALFGGPYSDQLNK